MKMKPLFLLGLAVYVITAGVTYAVASQMGGSGAATPSGLTAEPTPEVTEEGGLAIDPNEARDQVCPLSGGMYTKTEADIWKTRRPLAVMIENHPEARPQSGLLRADVVFEAMAEGGVTRFMAMYYCDAIRSDVVLAPVRSARTYYIDWASGFNLPMYVHVGGANVPGPTNALGQIDDYGWAGENDINQFSVGYPTFRRNYNRIEGKEVATEHTMVSSTEKLWEYSETKRNWTNLDNEGNDWAEGYKGWTFADGDGEKGSTNKISYEFWEGFGDYAVAWDYDAASNAYKRSMAGEAHNDLETNKQIDAKNVIIMYSKSKVVNELKHLIYQTTGTGTGLLFNNGNVTEINWSKPKRESELAFTDKKGKPVELTRGKTWISVVDPTEKITY